MSEMASKPDRSARQHDPADAKPKAEGLPSSDIAAAFTTAWPNQGDTAYDAVLRSWSTRPSR
jgi:hypothetical protein